MFYALSWFVVVCFLALWSLTAWALHAAAVWAVSHAGALSGAGSGVEGIALPGWLAPWVPPEIVAVIAALAAGVGPLVDSLLQAAPVLAGALTLVAWGAWAIGCMLLLLVGAGLHLVIVLWQRRAGPGTVARA